MKKNYGNTNVKRIPVLISDKNIYCEGGGRLLSDIIYPVGSIYISVVNTNPQEWFGGEWVSFGKGRVLVGVDTSQSEFNTVMKNGGEKTHTLTINEMPNHLHGNQLPTNNTGNAVINAAGHYFNDNCFSYTGGVRGMHIPRFDIGTISTGGGQAHNNLQPYTTVYMWRRIS